MSNSGTEIYGTTRCGGLARTSPRAEQHLGIPCTRATTNKGPADRSAPGIAPCVVACELLCLTVPPRQQSRWLRSSFDFRVTSEALDVLQEFPTLRVQTQQYTHTNGRYVNDRPLQRCNVLLSCTAIVPRLVGQAELLVQRLPDFTLFGVCSAVDLLMGEGTLPMYYAVSASELCLTSAIL